MLHRRTIRRITAISSGLLAATLAAVPSLPVAAQAADPAAPTFTEPYRPQFHFTPAQNWMNDPNGLVYYKGEYHLFFQYNPDGNQWGNMSWGHAVSTDLVHWKQLPLAIPHTADELIFSGSAVVDTRNTTGFGTRENPAMVAVYTSAFSNGKQAQSLAYSLDRGRTWTKYSGNPVIDIGSNNFRDPKVQWYAPTKSWLMTVSLSDQHKVRFYSSKNLKDWSLLSEFGPAGATGGVWECPDLFPLPVDGNKDHVKWVLVVNINPGGIAGGSGAQYFVGDFDGTSFTSEDAGSYTPPSGTVLQDFEHGYGAWSATGDAFGTAPASGTLEGQQTVSGFLGAGLVNSFRNFDAGTGTLTSPSFTVDKPYLNFLVGGGNHPFVEGAGDGTPPPGITIADFEGDTYGPGWTATGAFAGAGPLTESLPGSQGAKVLDTFAGGQGDPGTGVITSPHFTLSKKYVDFLIGGGNHPWGGADPTSVNLVVDGAVVKTATGKNSGSMEWVNWDVSGYAGKDAYIDVVDSHSGGDWGHIFVDQIGLSDELATPADLQTSVNLVVGSANGSDSESLDWASWNLAGLQGKQAKIQVVDHNTGGWGHLLADQFTLADAPALTAVQRARWVDYGKDYYAAVTWENAKRGERDQIGWMNNWDYANDIPTFPWRSAMSVPRELSLQTLEGKVRLVAQPVEKLRSLRVGDAVVARRVTIPTGSQPLAGGAGNGKALDITADFTTGSAREFGLKVRAGNGQQTVIGYDAGSQRVYVDRTKSGVSNFSSSFAGVQSAPLRAVNGKVHLRVLVDWSSVEVFGGSGQSVITDQIFPDASSQGVELFAEGGTARLDALKLWHLGSYRTP
jgi:fructan beta-fructosidase